MANLIKIGPLFLNLDLVQTIEDLFASTREDKVVVHFGNGEGNSRTFAGKDADDLRTWLNSVAVNLHSATESESGG